MKLRNKILALTIGLITMLGVAIIVFVNTTLTRSLEERLKDKSIMLTVHFAGMSASDLITENILKLRMMMNHYQKNNPDIVYIFMLDAKGDMLVHTFKEGFPEGLIDANDEDIRDGYNIQAILLGEEEVFDVAVPVLRSHAGILHIGYSYVPIRAHMSRIVQIVLGIVAGVLIIGIVIATIVASIIARPVRELTHAAKKVGDGDLKERVSVKGSDEIGQLGSVFNKMAEDLAGMLISRDYLDNIIKSIGNIMIITDINGRIRTVNQAAMDSLGYKSEEIVDTEFMSHVVNSGHEEDAFRDCIRKQTDQGRLSYESMLKTKDGKTIPVLISSSIIADREQKREEIIITAQDITKLKQTENKLKVSRELLTEERNSLRSSLETFSGIIKEVENSRGFDVYKYKPVENPHIPTCWEEKKCIFRECPVYGKERVRCWQIAGTHCGGKVQGKFALKFGDCEKCNVYLDSVEDPKFSISETFNNMMFILENAHKDLIDARRDAEESSRLKTEFLTNMSHEIRTPMNAIIGMTNLALDSELTDEQCDYLTTVQKSAYSLLELINDILDLSKIEAGKLTIQETDFNLNLLIEGVVDELSSQASEKGLEVMYMIYNDVPLQLMGDPVRIRQILMNLGGNAVKFTQRGEIVIRVAVKNETRDKAELEMSVTDTGIGIPEAKQRLIFEEFSQADGSTTRNYGGTGLGLSISRKIVGLMGGEIGVESNPDKGSRFWFTVALWKQSSIREMIEDDAPELQSVKVLAVTESETGRKILVEMLESFGCIVESAKSGAEAIEKLKRASGAGVPFGVVLTDMIMSGVDGEHTSIYIKNSPDIMDTAIIMLIPLGRQVDVPTIHEIGCRGYLVKPVKHSNLRDVMMKVIRSEVNKAVIGAPKVTRRNALVDNEAKGTQLLLVEDNPVNQKMASIILQKAGYKVDIVGNGREAVEAVSKKDYSLVLMDIQMPDMDGHEATQKIREEEEGQRHIPVIAMTAHAMQGDREKCLSSGMDDYISKPIEPLMLLNMIKKWTEVKIKEEITEAVPEVKEETADSGTEVMPVDITSAMRRFGDDVGFYKEMMKEFLDYVEGQIKAIEYAASTGDRETLRSNAHSIKGAAGNLSAQRVYSVALNIEENPGNEEPAKISPLINELKTEVLNLSRFVKGIN